MKRLYCRLNKLLFTESSRKFSRQIIMKNDRIVFVVGFVKDRQTE